jgi:hypothetical protein
MLVGTGAQRDTYPQRILFHRWIVPICSLLLLAALVPVAHAVDISAPVNVSSRRSSQAEAAIAVNPLNPQDVVVASNVEYGFGILVAVSHDGGVTWSRTVLGDVDRFGIACCDPTIAWDESGTLFLAWLGLERSFVPTVIPILMSTDAGDSWQVYRRLRPADPEHQPQTSTAFRTLSREDGEGERGGGVDQPTIAVGHRSLWVIWSHAGWLQTAGAKIRGLGDLGPLRGGVHDVPRSKNCTFGDLAVGPRGEVIQVCQRDVPSSDPRRSVLRVNLDADGLRVGPFDAGRVVARTNVSLFEPIPAQRSRTIDAEAGFAWDHRLGPGGRLYLIYTDEPDDETDNTDVMLMTSDDRGGSWTEPRAVVAAPRSPFLPRIAIDHVSGQLAIGFHDARRDRGSGAFDTDGRPNTDAMYSLILSADAGAVWTPIAFVSQGPSNAAAAGNEVDFGDYTGLAFVADIVRPAWADNSNSTGDNPDGTLADFDVYTAAVTATA